MKCAHAMPFGAQVRADGSVRFRLWAPAASRVDLVLERVERGTSERLPMKRIEGGFLELVTPTARAGSRYRYRIDDRANVKHNRIRSVHPIRMPASACTAAIHQKSILRKPLPAG